MDYRNVYNLYEDSSVLCIWSTGKYTLKIIYDVNKPHFTSSFSCLESDEDIRNYILNHTEKAFYSAIDKIDDTCYQLNIASRHHFYGEAGDGIYKRMTETYMPIIQKFMVDALTDTLKIDVL